jgi:hypothetical protein
MARSWAATKLGRMRQDHPCCLGGGCQLVEPSTTGKGVGEIVVERLGGFGQWIGSSFGFSLRGGDGGGQGRDRPLPGGATQASCDFQQGGSLFLGVSKMSVEHS